MKNENVNDLIVVEQLPIITEKLETLSKELDKEINEALKIKNEAIEKINKISNSGKELEKKDEEIIDESKKSIKTTRTYIRNIKTDLENRRKAVKNAIDEPYKKFETIYNSLVKDKLSNADDELKEAVDSIENSQLMAKTEELKLFANQYIASNNLQDIITFEDIPLHITNSASNKSLQDEVLKFITSVKSDINLINLEDYKDEILVEYKENISLGFSNAKLKVIERHKKIEEAQKKTSELQEKKEEETKIEEKVDEVITPVEIPSDEELIKVSFTITDTKEKIKEVVEFMKERGVNYE